MRQQVDRRDHQPGNGGDSCGIQGSGFALGGTERGGLDQRSGWPRSGLETEARANVLPGPHTADFERKM